MVMGERIDKQRIGYFFLDVMGKDVHQFYQSLYFSIFFKIYIINLCKFLYEFFFMGYNISRYLHVHAKCE